MDRNTVTQIVRDELKAAAPQLPEGVDGSAEFKYDLDLDSLTVLEFVARLEFRFGIAVDDRDYDRLRSVDLVVDYLQESLVAV